MLKYTTGELAKLCNVSVRTVQFYDTKNLLKPSEISEGGRRLYTEADVKKLSFQNLRSEFRGNQTNFRTRRLKRYYSVHSR